MAQRDRPDSAAPFSQDAGGLRLDSVDHALHFRCDFEKGEPSRLSSKPKAFVQAYLDHRVYLEVELRVAGEAQEIETPGRLAPFAHALPPQVPDVGRLDAEAPAIESGKGDGLVCVLVPELVEGPEGPVPSLVCPFRYHQGDYVRMHIPAAAPTDVVLDSFLRVCREEFGSLGVASAYGHSAGIDGMIESVPQIAGYGPNVEADLIGNAGLELNIEHVLVSFGVALYPAGPLLLAHEGFYSLFETGDAFARLLD